MSLTNAVSLFLHEIASNFRGALAQYGDIIGLKKKIGKGGSRERGGDVGFTICFLSKVSCFS